MKVRTLYINKTYKIRKY